MRHLIIGMGEVGDALFKVLAGQGDDEVFGYDIKEGKFNLNSIEEKLGGTVDILHICYPMSRRFVLLSNQYIKQILPGLTIVHSTVEMGTTRKLNGPRVSSPVRGVHPDLADGLRAYVKYIGTDDEKIGEVAKRAMRKLRCRIVRPIESAELMKNLSLARYGLIISFAREQEEICKKYGVTYEEVVLDWEVTYNEGLLLLGRLQHTRPLITPPQGKIGGHCVVPALKRTAKESQLIQKVIELERDGKETNYQIGERTKIWNYVNILKGAKIGKDCTIGSYVEIGEGVSIGDNCKIEAKAFIPKGVDIGDNVFIGPGVIFTNDLWPRAQGEYWDELRTTVENGVSIGAGSVIRPGIVLRKYGLIGCGSVVTHTTKAYGLYYGNPAVREGYVCECGHKLKLQKGKYFCPRCSKEFGELQKLK